VLASGFRNELERTADIASAAAPTHTAGPPRHYWPPIACSGVMDAAQLGGIHSETSKVGIQGDLDQAEPAARRYTSDITHRDRPVHRKRGFRKIAPIDARSCLRIAGTIAGGFAATNLALIDSSARSSTTRDTPVCTRR